MTLEDEHLRRLNYIMGLAPAKARDVTNLRNWVEYMGCITREETEYLTENEELVSAVSIEDKALSPFQDLIEDAMIYMHPVSSLVVLPRIYVCFVSDHAITV